MTYDPVEFTTDPAAFLAVADDLLAADPVVTTVVSTVTSRHRDLDAAGEPPPTAWPEWWAVVRDSEGAIAGLAMRTARTPPHPLFVLPMADGAALALARALHARGEAVGGANGALPAAEVSLTSSPAFRATGWRSPSTPGCSSSASWSCRSACPAGSGRRPPTTWTSPSNGWAASCSTPTTRPGAPPRPTDVRRSSPRTWPRIEHGNYWFWLDEAGERVHLTGANPPAFGVARIGPVYTPPAHRRKGYAGAAVAAVSALFRDAGARVCLFTDQANPTSNGIYRPSVTARSSTW